MDVLKRPYTVENVFLAAGVAEVLAVPSGMNWAYFAREDGVHDFFANYYDSLTDDDIVVNGGFDADTDWPVQGTGWSIAAGVAASDATQVGDSDLTQTPAGDDALVEGQAYLVTFEVTAWTAGNITPVVGGTEGTDRGSAAVFSEVIVAGSGADIDMRADVSFDGSIDDLSIIRAPQVPTADLSGELAQELNPRLRHIPGVTAIGLVAEAETILSVSFSKDDPRPKGNKGGL